MVNTLFVTSLDSFNLFCSYDNQARFCRQIFTVPFELEFGLRLEDQWEAFIQLYGQN
jgi:hypothetical protein